MTFESHTNEWIEDQISVEIEFETAARVPNFNQPNQPVWSVYYVWSELVLIYKCDEESRNAEIMNAAKSHFSEGRPKRYRTTKFTTGLE